MYRIRRRPSPELRSNGAAGGQGRTVSWERLADLRPAARPVTIGRRFRVEGCPKTRRMGLVAPVTSIRHDMCKCTHPMSAEVARARLGAPTYGSADALAHSRTMQEL